MEVIKLIYKAGWVGWGFHWGGGTWLGWWSPRKCLRWKRQAQGWNNPDSQELSPFLCLQGPSLFHKPLASPAAVETELSLSDTSSMNSCWISPLLSPTPTSSPSPFSFTIYSHETNPTQYSNGKVMIFMTFLETQNHQTTWMKSVQCSSWVGILKFECLYGGNLGV